VLVRRFRAGLDDLIMDIGRAIMWRRAPMWSGMMILGMVMGGQAVGAEKPHDLVLFTSIEAFDLFDSSYPELEEYETRYTADVLYTYSGSRFRALAEFIASSHENEMERLQAGWMIDDRTALWAGRFHSVSKFWTSEFHHGQFLQNSISRPKLEEWEDEQGPMPSHITGLWFERKFGSENTAEWSVAAAVGHALDVLDPESGHKGAANLSVTFRPEVLSTTQWGFMASWSDIAVDSVLTPGFEGINSVHQTTAGFFGDWTGQAWRVMGYAAWFDNELRYLDRRESDNFVLGYLQVEYSRREDWTLFGRAEFGPDQGSSRFLQMLPEFLANRQMLGARWDFRHNHSLTVEVAQTGRSGGDPPRVRFRELRFQWSAVFR
jgi:hypothetical protein